MSGIVGLHAHLVPSHKDIIHFISNSVIKSDSPLVLQTLALQTATDCLEITYFFKEIALHATDFQKALEKFQLATFINSVLLYGRLSLGGRANLKKIVSFFKCEKDFCYSTELKHHWPLNHLLV